MNPSDCRPRDYRRYFNNGWMLYKGKHIVHVNASDGTIHAARGAGAQYSAVNPHDLTPHYPEGACINTYSVGITVGRKARQVARRTASLEHYEVLYSPPTHRMMLDNQVMWDLCVQPAYPTLPQAIAMLRKGAPSVALGTDIILAESPTRGRHYQIIWHNEIVGNLQDKVFIPTFEGSCYTKLARQSLQELGISCL